MSGIVIPESLRKNLRPRRSVPGSAQPKTPAQVEKWVAKTYSSKQYSYSDKTYAQLFEAGLKSTEKTLATARREAHSLLTKLDAAGVKAASLETLAVTERMVWHISREASLAPIIAATRGLPDAVEVVARATGLDTGSLGGYTTAVCVVPAEGEPRLFGEVCLTLRHVVCAASEAEYVEAKRRAEKLRKQGGARVRAHLAYTFPDEPWGNDDLRAGLAKPSNNSPLHKLLASTSDAALIRQWIAAQGAYLVSVHALDLAVALPPSESVPLFAEVIPQLLVKPKYGPLLKTPPRDVAQALACIANKEAANVLAGYASHALLAPVVLAFFRDHPKLGGALEAQAKGKGSAKLEATAARVLNKATHAKTAKLAATSEVPPILRDAPWRSAKGAKPIVVSGLTLLGLDREKVALVAPARRGTRDSTKKMRDMTKKELADWKADVAKGDFSCADYEHGDDESIRIPDKEGLWAWNEKKAHLMGGTLAWVDRHGMATLPGFLAHDWIKWLSYDGNDEWVDGARSLISPRMAPMIARLASRKRWRQIANAWLVENAEVAAFGLIPDALSDRKEARGLAETALLVLARNRKDALVRKTATHYGKEAARGIDLLLDRDPLAVDVTVPKRPTFLHLDALPPVKTRSGKALGADAVSALVEMLQFTVVDDPYPGLDLARKACDEASLGDFAAELMEQWGIGDAPGRHEWMLFAVVHFPSERGTRRVAELAREWARKNMAKAERACACLAADGSDIALMHLGHIAETTRFAALQKTAGELVRDAAAARGLTEDELGDRTVPDGGLGADGTITLSYGKREVVVSCDALLVPIVREKTKSVLGPPAKTLPRPTKTDDAAQAKQARERFDQLKKDLAAIGKRQVRRLERAMVEGRTWPAPDFEERIAKHPLMRRIGAGLVWEVVSAKGEPKAFRIAEDGTYADAGDRGLALPSKATVRLAHPARTDGLATRWTTIFGDYEIVQPFEQLGRGVHSPTAAEKKSEQLDRANAIKVPARKLLGLMESRGWRRDSPGFVTAWQRSVKSRAGGELLARWPMKPGFEIELLASSEALMTPLTIEKPDGGHVAIGSIDDVAFSEIVRDIEAVGGVQTGEVKSRGCREM